jgi:hypothetical protein
VFLTSKRFGLRACDFVVLEMVMNGQEMVYSCEVRFVGFDQYDAVMIKLELMRSTLTCSESLFN